eukprot:1151341-Pelagomonas_calceolata.AAC.4
MAFWSGAVVSFRFRVDPGELCLRSCRDIGRPFFFAILMPTAAIQQRKLPVSRAQAVISEKTGYSFLWSNLPKSAPGHARALDNLSA